MEITLSSAEVAAVMAAAEVRADGDPDPMAFARRFEEELFLALREKKRKAANQAWSDLHAKHHSRG